MLYSILLHKVLYFGDDIDKDSGGFDADLANYEQGYESSGIETRGDFLLYKLGELLARREAANNLLAGSNPNFQAGDACDDLLELFHRVYEDNEDYLDRWEPLEVFVSVLSFISFYVMD